MQCTHSRCEHAILWLNRQPASPYALSLNTVHIQQFGHCLLIPKKFLTSHYLPAAIIPTIYFKISCIQIDALHNINIYNYHIRAHSYRPSHITFMRSPPAGPNSFIPGKFLRDTQAVIKHLSFYKPSSLPAVWHSLRHMRSSLFLSLIMPVRIARHITQRLRRHF